MTEELRLGFPELSGKPEKKEPWGQVQRLTWNELLPPIAPLVASPMGFFLGIWRYMLVGEEVREEEGE